MLYNVRTDLASEAGRLRLGDEEGKIPVEGLELKRSRRRGFLIEEVLVKSREAAEFLGKSEGRYTTLSLASFIDRRSEAFADASVTLSEILRNTIGFAPSSALVVALGNPDITPDALGSICASNIIVTRHMKGRDAALFDGFSSVSLCRTGVLGTTGIESAAHVKALCDTLKPQLVIAVDALAGADTASLCRSVQICDSGISPGSGVGNCREALDKNSLGVPVVSVGVPTVTDASAFCGDEELKELFVTPRTIDSDVRCIGRLIAYGINLALHEGLTVSDIDMLIG